MECFPGDPDQKLSVRCLRFHKTGDPRKVLQLDRIFISTNLKPNEVLIRYQAATILPAHINIVEGTYVVKAIPPAIPGNEAIGFVEKIGSDVRSLQVGDKVIPLDSKGAWTEYEIQTEDKCFKIHPSVDIGTAVTMLSNPITAWKMLKKYVKLEKGDLIVQNLANSHCGQSVIQIANALGYKTVNVVRNRPDIEDLKRQLKDMGADFVYTEEEFVNISKNFQKTFGTQPKLALNGAGGRSSLALAGCLANNGIMLVYGGMSKKPHQISTAALVFRNIRVLGVPAGFYLRPENQKERLEFLNEVHKLAIEKKLRGPEMDFVPMERFLEAMEKTLSGKNRKQLLILDPVISSRL
ncbi:unnamed protein product [Bursaphelenchus xylophilus]|uniref:Enoyl-[acyl-carrier-protein] reductase, mitochondrial n=1 Tax=Bursaphelenchus xylophilus TaxID=6326 RepID=A0A1I7RK68_BURXY|nr:unnamed protein product [Bursaphelenchus xylophilus]CAG9131465.1 unnamed protein product [Bursaphelenchus xylophilus]